MSTITVVPQPAVNITLQQAPAANLTISTPESVIVAHPAEVYNPAPGVGDAELLAHINDPTPHPAYDDIIDLVVLYESRLT